MSEADRFGGKGGDGRRVNMTPPKEQEIPRKQVATDDSAEETPHHGYDRREDRAVSDEPQVGDSYQSGGSALDREILDSERKADDGSGSWKSPHAPRGAADPAPGAPAHRRH